MGNGAPVTSERDGTTLVTLARWLRSRRPASSSLPWPGMLTTVIDTSLVVTFMACVLCLIGLQMTLSGGSLFVPRPIASSGSFDAGIIHVVHERGATPAGK